MLVAHAAGKTSEQLLRDLPLYCAAGFEDEVNAMLQRRLQGEPVAYITGSWEFYGIPLEITRDVLIPRPDTEIMVEAALRLLKSSAEAPRILDLCTGSGCIGLALAHNIPNARVVMVDNNHRALGVARKNAVRGHVETRAICVDADASKKPPLLLGKFDMVCCNAPYIPTPELADLDKSVIDYEPYAALDGGQDGLDIIRPVIALWKDVLKDGGFMLLEISEGQSPAVQDLLRQAGFGAVVALKDPGGTERIIIGQLQSACEDGEEN